MSLLILALAAVDVLFSYDQVDHTRNNYDWLLDRVVVLRIYSFPWQQTLLLQPAHSLHFLLVQPGLTVLPVFVLHLLQVTPPAVWLPRRPPSMCSSVHVGLPSLGLQATHTERPVKPATL